MIDLHHRYPIPTPPDQYDDAYRPKYMIITTIDQAETFSKVDAMNQAIDDDVAHLVRNAIIASVIGLVIVIGLIIPAVSQALTKPLVWMCKVADTITSNAGSDLDQGVDPNEDPTLRCSPHTEVTDLVTEFKEMIRGFDSKDAAKTVTVPVEETLNITTLATSAMFDSLGLYTPPINAGAGLTDTMALLDASAGLQRTYPRRNLGLNCSVDDATKVTEAPTKEFARGNGVLRSRLFWWIVLAMVVPILATMVGVSVYVASEIKSELPTWLQDVKTASVALEQDAVVTTAKLRAQYAKEIMAQPIRDLHLYTRTASWLYLGALKRTAAFTEMKSGTDSCKTYKEGTCPFVKAAPCNCDWFDSSDPQQKVCTRGRDPGRAAQTVTWSLQADDADPATGARTKATRRGGRTAASTSWVQNLSTVPGNAGGAVALGTTPSTPHPHPDISYFLTIFPFI